MGASREDLRAFPETVQDSLGFELYRVQCGLEPKDFQDYLSGDTPRRGLCIALLPEEDAADEPAGFGIGEEAV
jgi:hypothetical protein